MDNMDSIITLPDLLQAQEALESEALDILPGKVDQCSFDKGYVKQPVNALNINGYLKIIAKRYQGYSLSYCDTEFVYFFVTC